VIDPVRVTRLTIENAASVAALTIYDMCKAIDKTMTIDGVRLASAPAYSPAIVATTWRVVKQSAAAVWGLLRGGRH
jgi:predicted amino acid dehydrogenase